VESRPAVPATAPARESLLVVDASGRIGVASGLPASLTSAPGAARVTLERVFGEDAPALRRLLAELLGVLTAPPDARVTLQLTEAAGGGWADATLSRCDGVDGPLLAVRWTRTATTTTPAGATPDLAEHLRSLLRYTQDAVLVIDALGRILDVYGSYETITGWTREQLVGRHGLSLLHERDRVEAGFRLMWHTLDPRRAGRFAFEARVRAADGSYRWAEFVAANRFDDSRVRGIVVTARYFTPAKDIEASLQATERRLETALWASRAAYWSIDVATDRAAVSPQFFALTGIDASEWARDENPWNDRMHPDDRARVRATYEQFIAGEIDLYECEYRVRTPSGWLWLHDRGRVVERDADGRPARIAGTSLDATARKGLERAVADATAHERRRLSYDLHDGLGQELAGIQFMLASLVRDLDQAGSPFQTEARQVLEFVQGAIRTTRSLAHGLLPENFDGGGLLPALRRLAADLSRGFGLVIQVAADDRGGALAKLPTATMEQLYRICQEAIANGHRHGAAGRIDVALRVHQDELDLTVDDDGTGLDAAASPPPGIGLQIMRHRAHLVGGRLEVVRRDVGGTRVRVRCPISSADPNPSSP
jgi:PAS domain S-box-containing protein